MRLLISLLLGIAIHTVAAQNPATNQTWINSGKVSARITSAGIHADSLGGFVLGNDAPGLPPKNLLGHLAPWIGGLDPAGNLKLACEMDDPTVSDWQQGIRGVTGSGKVWKVSREQISEHISDFQDNGVIDNPIPAIFAWPAPGNPHSTLLNEFAIPPQYRPLPHFYDHNNDGIYDPYDGDYPTVGHLASFSNLVPEQLVCAPFFDNGLHALSASVKEISMNGMLTAFTLDCNEKEFAQNTIFFAYSFSYEDIERADSAYFGLFADFELGYPHDDYLGCSMPKKAAVYCYNADTLNDLVAGQNPAMISINSFRGPLDTFGNLIELSHAIPILHSNEFPAAVRRPHLPIGFYRYLSGHWRDGSPLLAGGIGYNSGGEKVKFAFPGHPSNADGWSEISASNPLSDREMIISYGPLTIKPGAVNEVFFSISALTEKGPSAQLQRLDEFRLLQEHLLENNPIGQPLCASTATKEHTKQGISVFPNPASSRLIIRTDISGAITLTLFNAFGSKVLEKTELTSEGKIIERSIANLPAGLYILRWEAADGRHGTHKIIVQH
ncbi:MAG: T9SS type A sorting domain-containing protein [Saprospiraceae bacterium]|nr:T9SS type A sorting domain-containing protein [Saprospiraceae bacterium]